MHACSTLPGNPLPYSCCLCLHCFSSLETAQVPRMLLKYSLRVVGCHQPSGMVPGLGKVVIDHWYSSQPKIFSRPTLRMVGRPYLPAEPCYDSSRGQTRHGNAFQSKCLHNQPPYHAMNSRAFGARPSGHQSRISMHDGPRCQVVHLM